jgi:hypothetical protein
MVLIRFFIDYKVSKIVRYCKKILIFFYKILSFSTIFRIFANSTLQFYMQNITIHIIICNIVIRFGGYEVGIITRRLRNKSWVAKHHPTHFPYRYCL